MKNVLLVIILGFVVCLAGCEKSKEEQRQEAERKMLEHPPLKKSSNQGY